METRVGTCGWSFEHWRGPFYPPGTKDELVYYAGQFNAVEIDSTWYRIPSRKTAESWRRRTPEGFIFCPKLPGEVTHEKLLEDSEDLVRTFVETMSLLQGRLGGILVQLSPQVHRRELPYTAHLPEYAP